MPLQLPELKETYPAIATTLVDAKIEHYLIQHDSGEHPILLGCDPGQKNSGLAIITPNYLSLYQITFPTTTDTVERISNTLAVLTHILMNRMMIQSGYIQRAIVEQAAYNMPYGQAGLAEVRSAMIVGLLMMNVRQIEVLPPATWRKRAFGHGKTKAEDYWPNLPKDASSALGIAFAGLAGLEENS